MLFCYEKGVALDNSMLKLPRIINIFLRWLLFIGGTFVSIWILIYVINIGGGTGDLSSNIDSEELSFIIDWLPNILIIIIIGFAILAILISFRGKLNAWLGFFYLYLAIYASYLFIDIFQSVGSGGTEFSVMTYLILIYSFEIIILLISIGGLIGRKARKIKEKVEIVKVDAIIIWLIFSKAAYEFADVILETTATFGLQVSILKSLGLFLLFIPLVIIIIIKGIKNYTKKKTKIRLSKSFAIHTTQ